MLKDRVVIVIGGAGLIGSEFARAILAQRGIAIIADIAAARAAQICESAAGVNGRSPDFISVDIADKQSLSELLKTIHGRYGRIDAVVNSAYPRNQNYGKPFDEVEYSDFCENLGLNLGGCFLVAQQVAEYFRRQGHGNIVNIASIYGVIAPRFEIYNGTSMTMPVEYAAIKAGVIHLGRYLAKYLAGTGIRVNTISPGGVFDVQPDSFVANYSRFTTSGTMLNPSDLSGTLVYLLSDASQHVNGQNIIVDDGFTL